MSKSPNNTIFLPPWAKVGKYAFNLVRELERELHPNHVLWGHQFTAIAQRTDRDDVLFEVKNDVTRYAVVHLTWTGVSETDQYPFSTLYDDYAFWLVSMNNDNVQFNCIESNDDELSAQ
jgi:hypothetical protein